MLLLLEASTATKAAAGTVPVTASQHMIINLTAALTPAVLSAVLRTTTPTVRVIMFYTNTFHPAMPSSTPPSTPPSLPPSPAALSLFPTASHPPMLNSHNQKATTT